MPRYLPDDDEVVCGNCSEPYLAELEQADGVCPPCRDDPGAAAHLRSLQDGTMARRLAESRAELEALRPRLLAKLLRLSAEGEPFLLVLTP